MASGKSGQRIEPSFGSSDDGGDLRVDASDRVSGGGSKPKRAKSPERGARREKPGRRAGGRGSGRSGSGGGFFGLVRRLAYWCIVLGIWGAIGVGGLVLYYGARMPSATSWSIPNGRPTSRFSRRMAISSPTGARPAARRSLSEDMSPYIPGGIAIEDRRFYSHFGVDRWGWRAPCSRTS